MRASQSELRRSRRKLINGYLRGITGGMLLQDDDEEGTGCEPAAVDAGWMAREIEGRKK